MPIHRRTRTAGVAIVLLLIPLAGGSTAAAEADDPLAPAARALAGGELPGALAALRELFESGYESPSAVYADPRFAALRDMADGRGPWRELMGDFVTESRIVIAGPHEPGTPMLVQGRVVRPDGEAVAGAVVYFYHTDATGNYEPDVPVGQGANPRLFAFVRTDAEGRFEVRTIEPEPYPGAGGPAAHVHYRVTTDGHRRSFGEFRPYTRPADADERAAAVRRGQASSVVREEGGELICEVTIPLRPE